MSTALFQLGTVIIVFAIVAMVLVFFLLCLKALFNAIRDREVGDVLIGLVGTSFFGGLLLVLIGALTGGIGGAA